MNETKLYNLSELSHTYNNICININDYTSILFENYNLIHHPNDFVMKTGNYATIFGIKIWIFFKFVDENYIRVTNEIDDKMPSLSKWSAPIDFSSPNIMKRIQLKAFW